MFKFLEKRLKERLKNETKEAADEVDATSHPTMETEKVESVGMQSLDEKLFGAAEKFPVEHEERDDMDSSQIDVGQASTSSEVEAV